MKKLCLFIFIYRKVYIDIKTHFGNYTLKIKSDSKYSNSIFLKNHFFIPVVQTKIMLPQPILTIINFIESH